MTAARWQMPEFAKRQVVSCLRDLADTEMQERTWIQGQPGGPVSPSELVSQLFDDTALGDYLAKDGGEPVFSVEVDALLLELSRLVGELDLNCPADLLRRPKWRAVQNKAALAADLITGLHDW